MQKRFGFTLAEVLITLGIIGVVAAMTIPTLINGTNNTQFRTGYKKIISTLNQAITMNVALDDTDFTSMVISPSTTSTVATSLAGLINGRMNVVKGTVGAANVAGINDLANNYTFFFNDGMAVSFPSGMIPNSTNCPTTGAGLVRTSCTILVDINGAKKPNALTTSTTELQDQFGVKIYGQTVRPSGIFTQVLYN